MTAERKYTDRDVRQDSTLRQIAENYIVDYGGDFEPLVNAVRMMEEGEELPTNVIRVVLNCMRHDPTVARGLPNPSGPILEVVRNVSRKKKSKLPGISPCDLLNSPDQHSWREPGQSTDTHWCKGVPFPIERHFFKTGAVSRRQFVLASSGKLVHTASLEDGSGIYWRPKRHEFGMAKADKLVIKILCRYPSAIVNPILLDITDTTTLLAASSVFEKQIKMCPHCESVIQEEVNLWQAQQSKSL